MSKLPLEYGTNSNLLTDEMNRKKTVAMQGEIIGESEPTVGSVYAPFVAPAVDNEYDNGLNQGIKTYGELANTKINENDIRQNTLNQFQKEIDATNMVFKQKLAEATQSGESALGSTRAAQARGGLLGSDFGAAQKGSVVGQNNAIYSNIRNEQNATLAAIMGKGRAAAAEEIKAKRLAQQEGLDQYLNFLQTRGERRASKTNALAASLLDQGVDITKVDPNQLDEVAKAYGVPTSAIVAAYTSSKQASELAEQERQAQLVKDNSFELSEGQSRYVYNPATGGYNMVASKSKTYAPQRGSSGVSDVIDGSVLGISTDGTENSTLSTQPAYSNLGTVQKGKADSLNNLVRYLREYKDAYDTVNELGTNLAGADSAVLESKLNSILFAAAQAEGTGALQAADREVLEKIIPNPTTIGGALSAITKGGKKGSIMKIDDQINKYVSNLEAYGLTPTGTRPMAQAPIIVAPDGTEYEFVD